jgi:hypothetical protein
MAFERVRAERQVWQAASGTFMTTGEISEGDNASLKAPGHEIVGSANSFLKGPVPWPWIVTAATLPGKALLVGLCLWRLAGAMKTFTVVLGNADLASLHVDRASKSRALSELERVGLVKIQRQLGRFPRVTLIIQQ